MDLKDKFTYMLAPLEDMTNATFRALSYKYGADLVFTELVRFESLAKNNKTTWRRIELNDDTPTVIQLIGAKEQFLKKFMKMFEPKKGFEGFNLNLGCPAPNFVNNGVGAAMIKRINKTRTLINIIKDNGYQASIKMRVGLNQFEKEKKAHINLLKEVNADYFIIHARHGKQTYNEKADWKVFPECVKTGKVIIANGDIRTKEHVEELKSYGVKGVMLGRAAIQDPGIFGRLKCLPTPPVQEIRQEYQKMLAKEEPFRYQKNILKHLGKEEKFSEETTGSED
jgi:tRNA-dihydrouridine synthase B